MDRNIHYYGHAFPPDHFTNKGIRGWWIRVLNFLRYELECRIQYHVTRCLNAEGLDDLVRAKYRQEQQAREMFREGRPDRADLNPTPLPARPLTPEEASIERLKRLVARDRSGRYVRGRRIFVYGGDFEDNLKGESHVNESGQATTEDGAVE